MRSWSAERLAAAAGAELLDGRGAGPGPERITIDSRHVSAGELFVGLPGEHVDGGAFVGQALAAGAWGALARPERLPAPGGGGVLLACADPLAALQHLATAWRRELGATVVGITGSTGKTSTKELLLAVLRGRRRAAGSRANLNTEIGMPIEILGAPDGTEVLVLEMAMRGAGQIAELAAIAEPDVGVIVNVGPAHLEQLGSMQRVAAAKSELLDALAPGATAVVPAGESLLAPHLRGDLRTITFGGNGDVRLLADGEHVVEIDALGERLALEVDFRQEHMRRNLLAAVAAAIAVGVTPSGRVSLPARPGRGQTVQLAGGVTLIDDCYNANPMSMRAALDELAVAVARGGGSRQIAVLGDMLELGERAHELHAELGDYAVAKGVALLVTVGQQASAIGERFTGERHAAADADEAAAIVPGLIGRGDVVLVKGSRGVKLERVCEALRGGEPA